MTFHSPALKKAIKAALDMGLAVVGFEIGQGGEIRVHTAQAAKETPDTALESWQRGRNG